MARQQQQQHGWGFFRLLGLALIMLIIWFAYIHGPQILAGRSGDWRGSVQSASESLRAGIRADMSRARAQESAREKVAQIVKRLPACSQIEATGDHVQINQIHIDGIFTSDLGVKCHN